MSQHGEKDVCELIPVEDDAAFRAFLESRPSGLAMIPEMYGGLGRPVLRSDAGDFAKWLKANASGIQVETHKADLLDLRCSDIWLPLVFLATNVALPVYLNLVSSYLYEKMKGGLRGDKPRVHVRVEYQDLASGTVKRFNFEGDAEAFQHAIKKFDLNRFFDG